MTNHCAKKKVVANDIPKIPQLQTNQLQIVGSYGQLKTNYFPQTNAQKETPLFGSDELDSLMDHELITGTKDTPTEKKCLLGYVT